VSEWTRERERLHDVCVCPRPTGFHAHAALAPRVSYNSASTLLLVPWCLRTFSLL
jgi:hypothetical protein